MKQLSLFDFQVEKGAHFSPCRVWRYSLWRIWDPSKPAIAFCCLNPSTADELIDDPTVRRCIQFSKNWGYGSFTMLNAYAYRSTDPRGLKTVENPVGEENDVVLATVAARVQDIIVGWGVHCEPNRAESVLKILGKVHCLGVNENGSPKHPLYIRGNAERQVYGHPTV